MQHFLYSSGLTHKLVQHLLSPIKKRVHNGAVKSRDQFNYNLRTLLAAAFNTLTYQIVFAGAQVRVVQL